MVIYSICMFDILLYWISLYQVSTVYYVQYVGYKLCDCIDGLGVKGLPASGGFAWRGVAGWDSGISPSSVEKIYSRLIFVVRWCMTTPSVQFFL